MKEIYRGKHLIHYGQVVLRDFEDNTSYPTPEGPLPWTGPKGICVPAKNDAEIEVRVYSDNQTPPPGGFSLLAEAFIEIGSLGIQVGNITTASTAEIDWPAGQARIRAYYAGDDPADATTVAFVLMVLPH